MFTKSILLPFLLVIIFVSASQASRQLWDSGISEMFGSKSGFHHGFSGFSGSSGGAGGAGGSFGDMMNAGGAHTCSAQGACSGKKLTCPEECYKSTNVNKDGYKSTSRSGGCSFDCTTKCAATCSN
ncbi:hypothetical protein AtNW77_Chr2g0236801 [Arabidopsis thaliana]|uniref:Uncharacterized protein n=5 Tax=Arabidopsis TaxID=3701 RepID=A0A178VXR7_ARATH|nr:uncharacterized protein AT2G19000 [Arabidopsis thaliana]KAG7636662.1 hypothetical protein ISN45_At02g012660 [Arabidopsis thaliana x Arabidopsis arenosa]KAG7641278.1 hypothetical protein ISN44_As02g013120 [Arabidopsis suecica]AAD12018.1 expressed protein [Arabidopsis thaliana]AAM14889.1 expressed protein [Arabidopsis thaliana]AAM64454.1 unknown [Arabidopsis thaliana]|eukprot:NP_565445.1 hypothetical protein AT2G19000 [Arabidopsis thaliana]